MRTSADRQASTIPDGGAASHGAPWLRPKVSWIAVLVLMLGLWTGVAWFWSRAPQAAGDMTGWRQSDTQTIALNLLRPGSSLFYPSINWGGDGPGYVESELPLYAALVALVMRFTGPAEWPGQLVSLLAVLGAGLGLFLHHRRREGVLAAFAALAAFLGTRSTALLSTAIQPDGLALLGYTLAWIGFSRYVDTQRRADLALFGVCGALAMLAKPTVAHIGISSGVLLLLSARHLLKRRDVWLTWAVMVLPLGLYLLHAKGIYETYGNTFGLLSGGDSKSPHLEHLVSVKVWLGTAKNTLMWGLGGLGIAALAWLGWKRRLTAEHVALAVGNFALMLIALRYVSTSSGPYYLAPLAVLGASAVARVIQVGFDSRWLRRWGVVAVFALAMAQLGGTQWLRHRARVPNQFTIIPIETGVALRERMAGRDALIAVRAYTPSYNEEWKTEANFQDPTIFYLAWARGWTFGSERLDPALVEDYVKRGARYLADPAPAPTPNRLHDWLLRNAELLVTTEHGGQVWRLGRE